MLLVPLIKFSRDQLENLILIARDMTKKLRVTILCEGDDDINALKVLIDKMSIQVSDNIGLNDCGGISRLEELAPIVATLARVSRRLEKIVLMVDANTQLPGQRVISLKQSLESHQVMIENLEEISGSIYKANFEKLDFLIKIVGKTDLPFKSHEMEDYAIHLLVMRGEIEERELSNFHKASEFLDQYGKKADMVIQESQKEEIARSYENVINLLKML